MLNDVVSVLPQGVLYYQNTTPFHGTQRSVITQEAIRKVQPFLCRILRKSKILSTPYVRMPNSEFYSKRTKSAEKYEQEYIYALNKL